MPGFGDADQGRREHGPHRPRIDPAIGMTADGRIDRAMVEAGGAADAAKHVLEGRAQQLRSAIVEENDMELAWPVEIVRPPRPGRKGGVDRELLAGGGAGEQAQDGCRILEGRHHLLQAGDDDMGIRQSLGQIAIAFIGDDDGRSGLGDEKIGAGDADIGGEEFRPEHGARFVAQLARLGDAALGIEGGVARLEGRGHVLLGQVHGRGDDMARRLAPELDDVFAEVGLDRLDAVRLQMLVELDLFGDHRLALGHAASAEQPTDAQDRVARLFRRAAPMHLAAGLDHLCFEALEIEIEMLDGVVLDVARLIAQPIELRQLRKRDQAPLREAGLHEAQRPLQAGIGHGLAGVCLEIVAGRLHRR